jgi:hypothetical protein
MIMEENNGRKIRLFTVILFSLALLTACMSPNEEFIQGDWFFDHQEIRANPDAYHLPFEDREEFTFDHGHYRYYSCCNHNINESGRYNISKSEENIIVLDLVCETGNCFTDRIQVMITIDKGKDTLRFFRTTWQRIYPR